MFAKEMSDSMSLAKFGFPVAVLSCAFVLVSCAGKFPRDIPAEYTTPDEHTFSVSYEKAWQEVLKTISGETRVRSMDKDNGVIITEFVEVDGGEAAATSKEQNSAFGMTYKNSYAVKLTAAGHGKTTINVRTNLREQYFAVYDRECSTESLAAYLRQELFRKICGNLYSSQAKCMALFPSHNTAVCLPPAPVATPEDEVSHPDLDPMWKLEINIRELQQALAKAGYDPGPIDGRMGKKTRAALIRFQKDNKLEPSGKLDESTMIALEI